MAVAAERVTPIAAPMGHRWLRNRFVHVAAVIGAMVIVYQAWSNGYQWPSALEWKSLAGSVDHFQTWLSDQQGAAHPSVFGNARLPGNANAAARGVEHQPVIAALNAVLNDAPHVQRRGAVAAAVGERGHSTAWFPEQHDEVVADAAGERLGFHLVGPGGDVPGVPEQHRRAPSRRLRRIAA